jgi:hypothetical protein
MRPILANPALKPSAADVGMANGHAQELLELRFSTPLFRLGSADLINQKVSFPLSGTAGAKPGVVVMRIDDTVGPNVDLALRGVLVVFNATIGCHTRHPGAVRSNLQPLPRPGRRLGPGRQADQLDRFDRNCHRPGPLGRRTGPALEAQPVDGQVDDPAG